MKEIGGYLDLEKHISNNGEYYKDLICINIARNSLAYVVKKKNISKIYIPYLLCNSISLVCDRENIKYDYYNIDGNFYPIFNKDLKADEYLYLVNYYGQINNEGIVKLKNKYKNIIVDNVQAFFQKPIDGIDTIYSCRKFFGVPDGSYLSSNIDITNELDIDNSDNRLEHIYGRAKDGASKYYEKFKEHEKSFRTLRLMKMSNKTHDMLSVINYDKVKKIRTENYQYLFNKLGKYNKLNIKMIDGAYAYPLYCNNGLEVKKKLALKGIYVATLWPIVLKMNECVEKDYAENILPLPCDQRYTIEDMKIIEEEIKKYV